MHSLADAHTMHIYLAVLVVAEKLLQHESWRDHLTASKVQHNHLAENVNLVLT